MVGFFWFVWLFCFVSTSFLLLEKNKTSLQTILVQTAQLKNLLCHTLVFVIVKKRCMGAIIGSSMTIKHLYYIVVKSSCSIVILNPNFSIQSVILTHCMKYVIKLVFTIWPDIWPPPYQRQHRTDLTASHTEYNTNIFGVMSY